MDEMLSVQETIAKLEARNAELEATNSALTGELAARRCEVPSAAFSTKDSTAEQMIQLPGVCRTVMDTLPFQRLRDLLQLGGAYWVYITAHHKRFDHCVGTAFLAFQLVTHLARHQPELQITQRDILAVTIAAQCHDLGHGLLSHAWDAMVMPRLFELEKARRLRLNLEPPQNPPEHEDISVLLFRFLAEGDIRKSLIDAGMVLTGPQSDLTFICELINPKHAFPRKLSEPWPFSGRPREKAFLWEIVSNKRSGIDVDKLDYIRRDCHNTGVKGVFEVDRIIHNTRVCRSPDGLLTVCWPEKEVENLYEVFHTRDSLHRRVYQHRVAKVVESMVGEAIVNMYPATTINGSSGPLTLYEACFDPVAFLRVSDWFVHLMLHGRHIRVDWEHAGTSRATALVDDVVHRQLWKTIGVVPVHKEVLKNKDAVRDEIYGLLPSACREMFCREQILVQSNNFSYGMGDKDPIEEVVFFNAKRACGFGEGFTLKKGDTSKMLPASFSEVQLRCVLKSPDPTLWRETQTAFNKWCDAHGCGRSRMDLSDQKRRQTGIESKPKARRVLTHSKSEPYPEL